MLEIIFSLLGKLAQYVPAFASYLKGRQDGRAAATREALEARQAEAVAQQARVAAAPRSASALSTLLRDKTKDF